uniref:CSON011022 protein n=1 Tax=Culicoides sonorensis TaxID=179676 RepID=A0A336KH36_CULSO
MQQQPCSISELTCSNGKCVPLNKYCDNVNDCGDSSDEPRFCTKCNRTYHGTIGLTYNLELHRPKEDKIPYVCLLTFTASGGIHGDLIQITIDSFTIGKFTSYTQDGCPDGYLQISEQSRISVGGMWCGNGWGPSIIYSETRTLVLAVKLFKLSRDSEGYNFDFRIKYKVLPKDKAVVRYGGIKYEEIIPWSDSKEIGSQSSDAMNVTAYLEHFYGNYNQKLDKQFYHDRSISTGYASNSHVSGRKTELTTGRSNRYTNYTEPKYYLGDLIPGTYCSRIFSDCDKKACRLQSPNFPGVYPRNLTCYYAVRQHEVPPGKHALIIMRQPKGNLIWINSETQATIKSKSDKDKFVPKIHTWDECDNVQDYVTVYDGYTTRDPIIMKFCGGGQALPASISSGPELLVEFTTSPFGTFTKPHPNNINSLNGFQLEIDVRFVEQKSPTYAKNKRNCEFWIRGTGHGILESPQHSLPPNSTCLYHLQGTETASRSYEQMQLLRRGNSPLPSRFKVWISVYKFEYGPKYGLTDENALLTQHEDCTGILRIWDGPMRELPHCKDADCTREEKPYSKYSQNQTHLMTRFCRGSIPRSCDHFATNESLARPCTLMESFVSSSDFVTLELRNTETTVLRPLNFKLKYEFVDNMQDGLPIGNNEYDCNRKFISLAVDNRRGEPGIFRGVKNIFYFGRGGKVNMSCIYRFEGQRGERVRIVINRISTGNRTCQSKIDKDINRSYCFGNSNAKLQIMERPWHESILFPRSCICNTTNTSELPVIFTSTSREVEVHFTAINMTPFDDPDNMFFEGTYEFLPGPKHCKEVRRRNGPSGLIDLASGEIECRDRPWLIEAKPGHFLYLRLKGLYLRRFNPNAPQPFNTSIRNDTPMRCDTKGRVIITTGDGVSITACPLDHDTSHRHVVEVFSAGWNRRNIYEDNKFSPVISVEYLEPVDGNFAVTWLEMQRRLPEGMPLEECQYQCPELNACVNSTIMCDGEIHCPSGADESFTHCSALLKLPTEILAALFVLMLVLCCGCSAYIYRKIKRKCRRTSVLQQRLKSLSSMDTAVFDEKEN